MKKIFAIFILILLAGIVYAADREATSYKDQNSGETVIRLPKVKYEEGTIPRGQNGTLILTYFTKAYVNIYEGSNLDFNIYGDSMLDVVAKNSLILTKVNKDSADFLYSLDGADYKTIRLYPGSENQLQLNFTGKIPFTFVQVYKWKYSETPGESKVTLFFNTPVVPISKRDKLPEEKYSIVDVNKVDQSAVKNSKTWIYYTAGLIALLIALALLFKPKFIFKN